MPPPTERTIPTATLARFAPPESTASSLGDAASTRQFAARDLCRGAQVAPGLTLEEEVGRGGCGVVWSARWNLPSGIEKRVAVKRVNSDAADVDDQARRLRGEARLLARISHRAIVRVEDVLLVGGAPAILTELIEGADLGVLLERGPLPPRVAAELLAELASALEAAHAGVPDGAGAIVPLVHRDIKPANVRLTRWGEIKLLDFGAAIVDGTGFVLGSPGYLSPEALTSGAGAPGDLYALGVLLWECRMGERLGRLSSQRRVQAEQAGRAAGRLPELAWAELLARLLAWEPAARPSAAEARAALELLARLAPGPSLRAWAREVLGGAPVHPEATASQLDHAWTEEPDQTLTHVEILAAPTRPVSPPARAAGPEPEVDTPVEPSPGRDDGMRIVAIGAGIGLLGGLFVLLFGLFAVFMLAG